MIHVEGGTSLNKNLDGEGAKAMGLFDEEIRRQADQ
jgi:hypothetical protein